MWMQSTLALRHLLTCSWAEKPEKSRKGALEKCWSIIKPVKEKEVDIRDTKHVPKPEIPNVVIELEKQMQDAADTLDFERAIALRDQIKKLNERLSGK